MTALLVEPLEKLSWAGLACIGLQPETREASGVSQKTRGPCSGQKPGSSGTQTRWTQAQVSFDKRCARNLAACCVHGKAYSMCLWNVILLTLYFAICWQCKGIFYSIRTHACKTTACVHANICKHQYNSMHNRHSCHAAFLSAVCHWCTLHIISYIHVAFCIIDRSKWHTIMFFTVIVIRVRRARP